MQYRSATLLALATYLAIVFASLVGPAPFWADALPILRTTFIATSVVLLFSAEGRQKTLLLTFLAFHTLLVFTTETPQIVQRFTSTLMNVSRGGYYGDGLTRSFKIILHENFCVALSLIAVAIAHVMYSKFGKETRDSILRTDSADSQLRQGQA